MRRELTVALSLLLNAVAVVSAAADWSGWRGPDANGISPEKGLAAKAVSKKAWSVRTGVGYSSVSVEDGKVYALGNVKGEDVLYCLDAATGEEVWRYSRSCSAGGGYKGPRATPVVADGRVYTFGRDGRVCCVDAKTGKLNWSVDVDDFGAKNIAWQYSGSPLVLDGKVFLNAGKKGMAFNAKTGKKVWTSSGQGGYATPVAVIYRKKRYVAMFGLNALRIVEPRGGKVVASTPWPTKYNVNAADPVVSKDGSKIFITSGYGNAGALYKFNGRSLKQIWKNKTIKGHFSTPVLYRGNLYAADGNTGRGALVCVSFDTGRELWREKSVNYGSLLIADGKIFYMRDRGILVVCEASPKGFAKLAETKLFHGRQNWVVPALANGRLYCRGANGELVCMNLK